MTGSGVDVVVVGAGLAGLTAARRLAARGAKVTVLEARDRAGGRACTQRLEGLDGTVDLGGQWLGPTQRRMHALVAEFGLETFPTFHDGTKVLVLDGKRSTYRGAIPSISPINLVVLERTITAVEKLAARVSLARPLAAPDAAMLDGMSVESWKRRHVPTRKVRSVVDAAVRVIFGAEPSEISMLWFLAYANGGGGFLKLCEIANAAQETRVAGGMQPVADRLAASLGERVVYRAPVSAIAQSGDGVTVHSDGAAHRARFAVIAVPPALAGRIRYEPDLPAARDALTQRFPMGATLKCRALYDRPFWRDEGFSGEAVLGDGPVSVVFDNTSRDGKLPALVAFSVGAAARELGRFPEGERRRVVLEVLVRCFGPRAGSPVRYLDKDWSADPWTRGCPTGILPPGGLGQLGHALREPCGRLHWAGTETATEWCGYLEGAVQSGERAADEILERM